MGGSIIIYGFLEDKLPDNPIGVLPGEQKPDEVIPDWLKVVSKDDPNVLNHFGHPDVLDEDNNPN